MGFCFAFIAIWWLETFKIAKKGTEEGKRARSSMLAENPVSVCCCFERCLKFPKLLRCEQG